MRFVPWPPPCFVQAMHVPPRPGWHAQLETPNPPMPDPKHPGIGYDPELDPPPVVPPVEPPGSEPTTPTPHHPPAPSGPEDPPADAGGRAVLRRVPDEDAETLRYLAKLRLVPGAEVTVVERTPCRGPLRIRVAGEEQFVGMELGRQLRVEPRPDEAAERVAGEERETD